MVFTYLNRELMTDNVKLKEEIEDLNDENCIQEYTSNFINLEFAVKLCLKNKLEKLAT